MNPQTKIITLDQIKKILPALDLLPAIEQGFAAYSAGKAVVPPVGELLLDKGDVHIKYGYLKEDEYYVIKIASGFYDNAALDLPSGNGLMLLFRQKTGELVSVLLDEAHLTDIRTAVAGAIAAKYLAPKKVQRIGIVGSGTQARLQLEYLRQIISARDVLVWGRGDEQLRHYQNDMEKQGFHVEITLDSAEILRTCNLVVTATPSKKPHLHARDLQPGTHITAVGSDTPLKQELDAEILKRADLVVVDSISQCLERGETHQAIKAKKITSGKLVELGDVISDKASGRTLDTQITIADLTGVAVQDIKIAEAVFNKALKS